MTPSDKVLCDRFGVPFDNKSTHPLLMKTPLVRLSLDGLKTETRRAPVDRYKLIRPGDYVWMRERWSVVEREGRGVGKQFAIFADEWTKEDGATVPNERAPLRPVFGQKWGGRSSLHMPKTICRLFARVKAIRVEPLQLIDEAGAIAEGCEAVDAETAAKFSIPGPLYRFERLWDSINGKRAGFAWRDNPQVAVISYERILPFIEHG